MSILKLRKPRKAPRQMKNKGCFNGCIMISNDFEQNDLIKEKCWYFDGIIEDIRRNVFYHKAHEFYYHKTDGYRHYFPEDRYMIELDENTMRVKDILERIFIVDSGEKFVFSRYCGGGDAIIYSAIPEPTNLPDGIYYENFKVSIL